MIVQEQSVVTRIKALADVMLQTCITVEDVARVVNGYEVERGLTRQRLFCPDDRRIDTAELFLRRTAAQSLQIESLVLQLTNTAQLRLADVELAFGPGKDTPPDPAGTNLYRYCFFYPWHPLHPFAMEPIHTAIFVSFDKNPCHADAQATRVLIRRDDFRALMEAGEEK